MLRPQYTRRPFDVLIVGPPHSGKRTIAKQFTKCKNVFYSININTALPYSYEQHTDLILLMIDLTHNECIDFLTFSLDSLHTRYVNRVAVVVTKVDRPTRQCVTSTLNIQQIIDQYVGVTVFYANLESQRETKETVEQISRLIQINTCQYQNLDMDYVQSSEFLEIDYIPSAEQSVEQSVESPLRPSVEPVVE